MVFVASFFLASYALFTAAAEGVLCDLAVAEAEDEGQCGRVSMFQKAASSSRFNLTHNQAKVNDTQPDPDTTSNDTLAAQVDALRVRVEEVSARMKRRLWWRRNFWKDAKALLKVIFIFVFLCCLICIGLVCCREAEKRAKSHGHVDTPSYPPGMIYHVDTDDRHDQLVRAWDHEIAHGPQALRHNAPLLSPRGVNRPLSPRAVVGQPPHTVRTLSPYSH